MTRSSDLTRALALMTHAERTKYYDLVSSFEKKLGGELNYDQRYYVAQSAKMGRHPQLPRLAQLSGESKYGPEAA